MSNNNNNDNNNLRRRVLVTIYGDDAKKLCEELDKGIGIGFSYDDENKGENVKNPKIEIFTIQKNK